MTGKTREGMIYALVAYGSWGLVPLYFVALRDVVPAAEILAQRVVWSLVFLALLIALSHRWQSLWLALRTPWVRWNLILSALLVGCNWYLYITAVVSHQVAQGALGYFINPLVNVLLGMLFFRERLRPLQWVALAAACTGVVLLTVNAGEFPGLALALAFSFGFYALVRKKLPVDGLIGLSAETLFLWPLAGAYLVYLHASARASLGADSLRLDLLLMGSGVVTAVPLLCFGQATQRLPLSTLGFLQYLSPSLQFLLAVLVLGEDFDAERLLSFGFIWAGLAVFTVDSIRSHRLSRAPKVEEPTPLAD
ncbi:MAG: EamA family transporter RarD [Planctomycetes bacterium]|nr:EamA family transporter RarD [Planctomycetota bacterium]